MTDNFICRYWVGSDTKGHQCGKPADQFDLCPKHFEMQKARIARYLEKQRAQTARAEAEWFDRNIPRVPAWRRQLEQAEVEYDRRTASPVADRAAVGGAMHPSIMRSQASHLSDTNVARVAELDRIISRLRKDIARAEAVLAWTERTA